MTTTAAPLRAARQAQIRPASPPPMTAASTRLAGDDASARRPPPASLSIDRSRSSVSGFLVPGERRQEHPFAGITRIRCGRSARVPAPSQPRSPGSRSHATILAAPGPGRPATPARPRGASRWPRLRPGPRDSQRLARARASISSATPASRRSSSTVSSARRSPAAPTSSSSATSTPRGRPARRRRALPRRRRRGGALFILNDEPALAAEVGADGVHVGQDDTPVARGPRARRRRA